TLCAPTASVFFFQAEDGIRDRNVTGVQTCALPIYLFMLGIVTNINQSLDQDSVEVVAENYGFTSELEVFVDDTDLTNFFDLEERSEERRVGKECRTRRAADRYKRKREER